MTTNHTPCDGCNDVLSPWNHECQGEPCPCPDCETLKTKQPAGDVPPVSGALDALVAAGVLTEETRPWIHGELVRYVSEWQEVGR